MKTNTETSRQKRLYALLLIPAFSAVLALNHFGFFFKSGSAGGGILILLVLYFNQLKRSKDVWAIIAAFLFSIGGDWFLSHRHGEPERFVAGIALFFIAHIGYLWYALLKGRIRWIFTLILLVAYLLFFFLKLSPVINDQSLMFAALVYLLISCFSLGGAVGLEAPAPERLAYIFGIFLILFSDTIIAFREFLGYRELSFLILPTYYLAHLAITFSLMYRKIALN
ncbi:lysoplasmalogenase [Gaoshiqia sp. Z1-71]|uniref:lysoplasmalogenase n=1 Tax=Gaoshiqia hydrogeniformans TaxID=3290090 RepID=UPI003BF8F2A0